MSLRSHSKHSLCVFSVTPMLNSVQSSSVLSSDESIRNFCNCGSAWGNLEVSLKLRWHIGQVFGILPLHLFPRLSSLPRSIFWPRPVLQGYAQCAVMQLSSTGCVYTQDPQVLLKTSSNWSNVYFTNECKETKPLQTKLPLSISHMGGKIKPSGKRGLTHGMFGEHSGLCKYTYVSVIAYLKQVSWPGGLSSECVIFQTSS